MNIAVIGTGYVGLVTGTCFAETGNQVTCVDINEEKISNLKKGILPIYEPDLDTLLERNQKQGRLHFTTNLNEAVEKAHMIFLALPTPEGADGQADLSAVLAVSEQLGKIISEYKVIINKSTVPVGTADRVREKLALNSKVEFDVVSNPEFLKEGVAVADFMKPDRVVIGTRSERAKKMMEQLYEPFVRQGNPLIFMDERSSEMTKYAANAYLATRITFMNEIANLCERTGANVDMVRKGIGTDSRIGKSFLYAGIGYGGSCFPKDVKALKQTAGQNDYDFRILSSVIDVNSLQRKRFFEKVKNYFGGNLNGKKFAVWGIAFKPNTDDIREAPAIDLMQWLLDAGAAVSAYDPEAMPNAKKIFADRVNFCEEEYSTLQNADALLIVTEWNIFRNPDFDKMISLMKTKVIFDGRNLYSPDMPASHGFFYSSIGRKESNP